MAPSPQFFRIVLQRNLEDQKLMIPKKFVKDNGNFLSSFVRLKLPDGMEWKVGLTTATNGVVWMQKGWHKFAEYYSLEFGSLLLFRLDRPGSTFETTIFDPTGVETEYCCNFDDYRGKFVEFNDDDESDSDESLESFPRRSKKRENGSVPCRQSRKKMRNENSICSIKMEPEEEEGCDIIRNLPMASSKKRIPKDEAGVSRRRQQLANKAKATERFSSKSEKPGFKVAMSQSNVGGRFDMIIPKEFAEEYLSDEFGIINLQTSNGRNWPILYKWSRNRGNFAYISRGWKRFVKDNLLKEGDIGFFQMIEKDKFSFTKLQDNPHSNKRTATTTTRNPFFEVNIHFKTYKNLVLNIPMAFAKEHFSPEMHTAKLQVGKRQWNVTLKQYDSCVRFSAGWCTFFADNGLEDQDTCLFEMVNKKNCVFKVTIFKNVTSSESSD